MRSAAEDSHVVDVVDDGEVVVWPDEVCSSVAPLQKATHTEKNGMTKCASTQCRASMNGNSQLHELLSRFACVQQANGGRRACMLRKQR
jgi:hypothetical protein